MFNVNCAAPHSKHDQQTGAVTVSSHTLDDVEAAQHDLDEADEHGAQLAHIANRKKNRHRTSKHC
ncbi:unnamed protein product [Chondrus crispus]|uniref:Uncharacterized protein n=1 Tax=Chondrus crispus TaxID=2769 RepID=R7Q2A5_CHOCR|nr:unnamed protein product [Chondrus crispus]CDF32727.1 unnamed protein product [Chondrus crispus]|eukprot:XP_005712498.1 unnamed protein product [Chondrus crispus]